MTDIKRVKIQNFIENQIPEFLNADNSLFKEFLNQYYISLEHQIGTIDLANNFVDYKKIDTFNNETFFNIAVPCTLTENVLSFDSTIFVNTTVGFPSKYGLFKIDDEIITYTSKTNTTFEGCIRGFSGIDKGQNRSFNFVLTEASDHSKINSDNKAKKVQNLSLNFFLEIFEKFKTQFLPGFENRNLYTGLNLQNLLSRAKDFYISKGTDISYKILFKILYGEEVEIIKPQDYMLRPSDNKYFVTKNILVERIFGDIDPLIFNGLKLGPTLYQNTPNGLASATIYNIEVRPIGDKILYEISLDPDSFILDFVSTKKTNISEKCLTSNASLLVDSTVGFNTSGSLIVQTKNNPPFTIKYTDKSINQFFGISGNIINLEVNDSIIEDNFAYVEYEGNLIKFRIINIIQDLDYSDTFSLKIGDKINLSSFGLELNDKIEYNKWIYNIPTKHNIKNISKVSDIWRIELFDSVKFTLNESILVSNPSDITAGSPGIVSKIISDKIIEVISSINISDKTILSKIISKVDAINYSNLNQIPANIQNTYADNTGENLYVASTGLPSYRLTINDRRISISTPQNPSPNSGITTTTLDTNIKHKFYSGEKIYLTPSPNLGVSTGVYFVSAVGNYSDSQQISLSYSHSDLFSKKFINVSYGATGEFVKLDYQNKLLSHQNLLRKFPISKIDNKVNNPDDKITNNKPIGSLLNGVELYSTTLYDENIYYGKIDTIQILSGGNNYDVINTPSLVIEDSVGSGAKAHLNISGSIEKINIVSPGSGYQEEVKISISGGNGVDASLKAKVIKTKISSGFRGDGTGINPTQNSITFTLPHNFEDGEEVEYLSNSNREIEYSDPISGQIRKLPNNSFYFIGVFSDKVIKLYKTKEDAANRINEINLTTSPSFGFHYFRTLKSRYVLVDVSVENPGYGYSNKKIVIPSIESSSTSQNGIDIVNDAIYAKLHNFKDKDLVVYQTTGTPISGISTESSYYVKVIDENRFNLILAGVDNNISEENYNQNKIVRLSSVGVGTHTISYPPIKIKINVTPESTNGKLELPILEPKIVGSIESIFIENYGKKYGVSNIINFHRRPSLKVGPIKSPAILKPIIIDGKIIDIQILNPGSGYGKDIDIVIRGPGKFANIFPIIDNGKLISFNILNGGIGYDYTTTIELEKRGTGASLQANIFEWKINQVKKNEFLLSDENEGILVPSKNKINTLQFIHFYPPKIFRKILGDNVTSNNKESTVQNESPILGWSYDGFPIYGPYTKLNNTVTRVKSSYKKSVENDPNVRPTGIDFPEGFFIQDFVFDNTIGDLDEYNGRYVKNNDFPNGTYAYFYTIDVELDNSSIPQYPYIIGPQFKNHPQLENYDPKFNQNVNLNNLNLIRNISPYYLNSSYSQYGLIDKVDDKFKQEFIVNTISKSGVDSIQIYDPGNNYKVGDILNFDNQSSGGSGLYVSVDKIKGKTIQSISVGIVTEYPVVFEKIGKEIYGYAKTPLNILNSDTVIINNISSTKFKFIEGSKIISIDSKAVGLIKDIPNFLSTGDITKIYLNDISGFEVDDFVKINDEIAKIIEISTIDSSFVIHRLSNIGIHSAGKSEVKLLPRKFTYTDINSDSKLLSNRNSTIYFNASTNIGIGTTGSIYVLPNNDIVNIPAKTIYIPNHKFNTGQPLTYNPGINGTPLIVYNSIGSANFSLAIGQTVYAVNYGKDFVGLSTLGFTTTTGIGTDYKSLYFASSINNIGIAHSFTTQFQEVIGKVEAYSVNITTKDNHQLLNNDVVSLNIIPNITNTIKFRYDPIIQKITTELINFNSQLVELNVDEIEIDDETLNTGDKIVYYTNMNSSIGGLENNKTYFIIKSSPGKIKLAEYYSDALRGVNVNITSSGTGTHSIAKINPPIEVINGNKLLFDLSDTSLGQFQLRLYKDSKLTKELEQYSYIFNDERSLKTSSEIYPRELYYSFCSDIDLICSDVEVKNNNKIEILGSEYNDEYDITVIDNKSFKINLLGTPENLDYSSENLKEIFYTTRSKSVSGPIYGIKVNSKGNSYSKTPKLKKIISEFGKNAVIKAKSKKIGKISSLQRVKDGFDYPTDTTLRPLLSVPAVLQIENISRVGSVGILTGGKNYNTPPVLKVLGNDNIKLSAKIQGSSVVSVGIIENTNDLSIPLEIIPIKNSNGYSIDDIEVNGNLVTLELLNSNNQIYPLISTGYGTTEVAFPFSFGDEIFIERCRISTEVDANGNTIQKNNYNSANYGYRFFTVVGINTNNSTVTYSMEGISSNLGEYTSDFGYGYVVNRKDMAKFEMIISNDLGYSSGETVFGYTDKGVNTFTATVMENGWDNDINELRLINVKGDIKVGDRLFGNVSLLNGKVTDVNIFNLTSIIGVKRDKLNDLGDRVGILNDSQQRISDNNYYQKFSYSIRSKKSYNEWKEPVKSIIHPSGFKEFSDLNIESLANSSIKKNNLKVIPTDSSSSLTINIDNTQSMYSKNNFAMVTEEDQFEDGSIERVVFEDGVTLSPYILSNTNRVVTIDDISSQFTGTSNLEIIANKAVTFISTDLYRLGVNTEGLNVGDKIGFSTYNFYPDSTYILTIGDNFVGVSSDTPHRLYSNNGNKTSVTQNLNFYRRVVGDRVVGLSSFKLKNNQIPLFYREFDSSNGISTVVNLTNNSFTIPNHNFQTGQKIVYTPQYNPITAIANTTIGSGAILEPVFVGTAYSVSRINIINGGSGYTGANKPIIQINGTKTPFISAQFNPLIQSGIITSIQVINPGLGYFPSATKEIGIKTTTQTENIKDVIMKVGGGIGSAIYERGYNVSISTAITGVSSNITPNFSSQQNRFWGENAPFIPIKSTNGAGIDAKFSVFIVYNSTTGAPISTSIILRDGGRGYKVGDTVSIAGTYIGGATPLNDLSFKVSKISSTRVSSAANQTFTNIEGITAVGYGTAATFNIKRDNLGNILSTEVVYGGYNYNLTDNIKILGASIGGNTPLDDLFLSPTILGTDKLPSNLYVQRSDNNSFKVAGISTGEVLDLTSLGIGTHSFYIENCNPSSLISIDNIIQTPIYRKNLKLNLNSDVSYQSNSIEISSGISSVKLNDILQINDEYLLVKNVSTGSTNSVLVERQVLGTKKSVHYKNDSIFVLGGDYNIVKDVIYFTSPPYGPTGLPGFEINSSFSGRAFFRKNDSELVNDKNIIFDDISDQFTGIAATQFILKSNGNNVVGIFTNTNSVTGSSSGVDINNNPIILINNIPQIGGTDYIIDTPGQNTIKFKSGVPLAGKITKVGYNTGFGYIPLIGAAATVSVSAAGTISRIYLIGAGRGYRTPPSISIASTVGSGASIISTIGVAGTITSLSIVNAGSGYTSKVLPEIRIDLPQNYYDLDLSYASGYSGSGQGAKASVVVGAGSSIISFNLDEPGTSYKVGDVLVLPGISTIPNSQSFSEFRVTVLETFTDSFSGWYPGQFIQFDNISKFFNGRKKKFTLTITQSGNTEVINLKPDSTNVSITNNLFVFINDVLQVPNESYTFSGSRISFKEAPKKDSKCDILFFRGSDLDVEQIDPPKTIKEGDDIQIVENINDPSDITQFTRVVKNIVSIDIIDTFPYDDIGISTGINKIRPLNWTKQTQDRIINGVLYSKSRPSIKSRVIPTAKVIKDIGLSDDKIYVDSAAPLFEDIDENRGLSEDLRDIIILNNKTIESPVIKSIISTGSTISGFNIINEGSGYVNNTNPKISISSRFITKKDPIFNWSPSVGIVTNLKLSAVGYGTGYIAVGSSGLNLISLGGTSWNNSNSISTSFNFNDVIGYENSYVAVGSSGAIYSKVGLSTIGTWRKVNLKKINVDSINRVEILDSTYSNNFNKINYNSLKNTLVAVGDFGGIFSAVGIGTTEMYERTSSFQNINSIASNSDYFVAVGNVGEIIYSIDGLFWNIILNKITLQNLNDILWDGNRFIAVGNNSTIITSINGINWNLIPVNNLNVNLKQINYFDSLFTSIDSDGNLYFSLNLVDWTSRNTPKKISNIFSKGTNTDDIKYVSVGSSGFISYSTPILNNATAIPSIQDGKLSTITVTNGGFGYSTNTPPPVIIETDVVEKEQVYSIKAKGDFGKIKDVIVYSTGEIGFGTTSPAIEFVLESENYNQILPTVAYTPLQTGDYFVISNSNVICGHALTGITTSLGGMSNYPTSKVGTATSFIDGIYRVEGVNGPVLGISTVRCHFVPIPAVGADKIQVNIGINTLGFYGRYSFGVIYDYQNRSREIPKEFYVNKDNGLVGLSSGPIIYRTRGIL